MTIDLKLLAETNQVSPGLTPDGQRGEVFANREHALQINSREGLVDKWTREGRVFIANNPVIGQPETMSATGTVFDLTKPAIRYTVPSGAVVVPIHVAVQVVTVAAKDDIFGVIVNNANSFTSGGDAVAMTVASALVDGTEEMVPSTVINLHYSDTAIVEAALTNPRLLKILQARPPATAEGWNPEYNILNGDPMTYIVGPASFLVYVVQETAAAEAEFVMSWAVLEAAAVP